jgi:hypothetical protein
MTQTDQRAGQDRRDSSGIAVMQTLELLPTSRVIIGSRCGIIIAADSCGQAGRDQQQPAKAAQRGLGARQMQADGNRRDRQRQRHRNFRSKNGLRIAVITSGRTPVR